MSKTQNYYLWVAFKKRYCLEENYNNEMSKEKEDSGKKNTKATKDPVKAKSFLTDERIKFVFGILITGFALYLLLACVCLPVLVENRPEHS